MDSAFANAFDGVDIVKAGDAAGVNCFYRRVFRQNFQQIAIYPPLFAFDVNSVN